MRPNRIAVYCQIGDDCSKITRPGNAVEPDFQKVRQHIFALVTGGAMGAVPVMQKEVLAAWHAISGDLAFRSCRFYP